MDEDEWMAQRKWLDAIVTTGEGTACFFDTSFKRSLKLTQARD